LIVRGCEFQQDKVQVDLGASVRRAIVSENVVTGTLRVQNKSKGKVIVEQNASD
jgi:hypothetical protein